MRRAAAIAAALALALSGCGGGSDSKDASTVPSAAETQTKAGFVTQADQVCALQNQELATDEVKLKRSALAPGTTDPKLINDAATEQGNLYARISDVTAVSVAEIRKLTPPQDGPPQEFLAAKEGAASLYRRYSDALGAYSNSLSRRDAARVRAAAARVGPARERILRLGNDYGFRVCNESR